MKIIFAFLIVVISNLVFATTDTALLKSLDYSSPQKEILCLPENYHSYYEIEQEIELLKYLGQIDEKLCMDLSYDPTGHKKKLYGLVLENSSKVKISAHSLNASDVAIIYTPTSDHNGFVFENDNNGYLKTSAVVLGSIVLGNVISDAAYKGQADKHSHARTGGVISAAATAGSLLAAYFVPDSRLNPNLKKLLVGCSGFVVSTLAGAVKEVMDSRDTTKHTVDKHDFFDTSLGGGMGIGCVFSLTF